jgi:hypothetical protein
MYCSSIQERYIKAYRLKRDNLGVSKRQRPIRPVTNFLNARYITLIIIHNSANVKNTIQFLNTVFTSLSHPNFFCSLCVSILCVFTSLIDFHFFDWQDLYQFLRTYSFASKFYFNLSSLPSFVDTAFAAPGEIRSLSFTL